MRKNNQAVQAIRVNLWIETASVGLAGLLAGAIVTLAVKWLLG